LAIKTKKNSGKKKNYNYLRGGQPPELKEHGGIWLGAGNTRGGEKLGCNKKRSPPDLAEVRLLVDKVDKPIQTRHSTQQQQNKKKTNTVNKR